MKDPLTALVPKFPVKTVVGTILCLCVLLLGCSLHPFQRLYLGIGSSQERFYSYFILHGAAQSALGRGGLSPEQVGELMKADQAAKQNLVKHAFEKKMRKSFIRYALAIHPQ